MGGAFAGDGGEKSLPHCHRGGGHGTGRPVVIECLRGGILSAPLAFKSGAASCARLARAAYARGGFLGRTTDPSGKSEPGLRSSFGQPQHLEPAFAERDRLEGIRRNAQSGRANVARRAGGYL